MLSKKMEKAINKQINAEFASAYLYLSMSSWFSGHSLDGMANWMMIQFQEEQSHALKFYRYVIERGGTVVLDAIEEPEKEWNSPLHVFEETLKHEQLVTSLINNLVDIAKEERDYATESMLRWFIDEQVEEEANADAIVNQLKLIGDKGHGIFMIDREMKSRTFVDETQEE
jgi:ferritin